MNSRLDVIRLDLVNSLTEDAREAGLDALHIILTEDNTDALIDVLLSRLRLPIWLRWLPLRSVLDSVLPDVLLELFEDLLER